MNAPPGTCPRCGHPNDGREECVRCGIVFRKAHAAPEPPPEVLRPPPPPPVPGEGSSPALRRVAIVVVLLAAVWLVRERPWARGFGRGGTSALTASGWYEDAAGFEKADAERRKAGSAMIVYFHTDWCGWCKKLDADYLAVPEVQAYLAKNPRVSINPDHGGREQELARRYGVRGYPTFLVVPARGGDPVRVHPFRNDGHLRPAQFVEACRNAE